VKATATAPQATLDTATDPAQQASTATATDSTTTATNKLNRKRLTATDPTATEKYISTKTIYNKEVSISVCL